MTTAPALDEGKASTGSGSDCWPLALAAVTGEEAPDPLPPTPSSASSWISFRGGGAAAISCGELRVETNFRLPWPPWTPWWTPLLMALYRAGELWDEEAADPAEEGGRRFRYT